MLTQRSNSTPGHERSCSLKETPLLSPPGTSGFESITHNHLSDSHAAKRRDLIGFPCVHLANSWGTWGSVYFSTFSFAYVSVCFPKKWPGDFFPPLVLFKKDRLQNNWSWQSVTVSNRGNPTLSWRFEWYTSEWAEVGHCDAWHKSAAMRVFPAAQTSVAPKHNRSWRERRGVNGSRRKEAE